MSQTNILKHIKSKEIKSLTGVRGIAALYVAFYHSMENDRLDYMSPLQVFYNHGNLSVDLFFILSGFVMALSSKKIFENEFTINGYKTFLRRRFARVYPMYFIVICIGFAVENHFSGKLNFLVGLSLLSMLFAKGMVLMHLWSINAEWICYLLFPIFIYILYKYNSIIWTLLLILLGIFCIVHGEKSIAYAREHSIYYLFPKNYIMLKCFGEYTLGIMAFKISKTLLRYYSVFNIVSIVITTLIICMLFIPHTEVYIIVLMFPFTLTIAVEGSSVGRLLSSRIIYFLGEISYSLYLIHGFFLHGLKPIFYSQLKDFHYLTLLFNTVYLILVIAVSYICYRWIEIPVQRFINSYFTKQQVS